MCMFIYKTTKILIAKTDVVVYKALSQYPHDYLMTSFTSNMIPSNLTLVPEKNVRRKSMYVRKGTSLGKGWIFSYETLDKGIERHRRHFNDCIVEAFIPKGTKYIIHYNQVASKKLVLTKQVLWRGINLEGVRLKWQ